MQVTQVRSSSKKSHRCSRDSPDIKQKCNSYLIASKIGDLTQRNQTTCSKQLENRKPKNQADNTQYIRNLYKKYLGKQNNNNSDRKTRTDIKDIKLEKAITTDQYRQKLTYGQEPELHKIQSAFQKSTTNQTNLFRKISNIEQSRPPQIPKILKYSKSPSSANFYKKVLDNQILDVLGNQRSSLVLAMQTINGIRKKNR